MIILDGYPVVAKYTHLNFSWATTDNTDANFMGGTLLFDNVNLVAGAGEISKGRTALQFDPENPIAWGDDVPQAIKDAFASPQEALRYALGELYESLEHQYKLGTATPPEPTE